MRSRKEAFRVAAVGYTPHEHCAVAKGCSIAQDRIKDEVEEVRPLSFWDAVNGGYDAILVSKPLGDAVLQNNSVVLDLSGLDSESAAIAVADAICQLAFCFEIASLTRASEFDGQGLA